MTSNEVNQRGPRTSHDFILGGIYERVETAVEKRDDHERREEVHVDAYDMHGYQHRVYLVRQVRCLHV